MAGPSGNGQGGQEGQRRVIPKLETTKEVKLVTCGIEKLNRSNYRSWKSEMINFLKMQNCWKIVDLTNEWRDDPEAIKELLEDTDWSIANAKARHYIGTALEKEDKLAVQNFEDVGKVWRYLVEFYGRRNEVDRLGALRKVLRWKKDPSINLEKSLQQLEAWNADLKDISNNSMGFDELVLLNIFLDGLPQEYESMVDSIIASGKIDRGMMLSRLQQRESREKTADTSEAAEEFANRIKQMECFNCGKKGHFARDCRAPKKDREQSNSREKKESRKGRGKAKDRGSHRGRPKQKGKARTADEESDTDSDSTTSLNMCLKKRTVQRGAKTLLSTVEQQEPAAEKLIYLSHWIRDIQAA
ncbi:hypothetical protein EYZ11_013562 [Aspergillus tanneri]|uniref:CCHC-type domain-containing protein n=1 Tax=Aspergillus tanneri TaxID=1220188 RepID=A0A4S3IXV8_9EURO|nr:hypothetical protein EYZ11_013562 [Aspergillus tanneri]